MSLTTFLAVWGALLSTALAGWSIYRDLLDRGNIRLTAMIAGIITRDSQGRAASLNPRDVTGDPDADHLAITITNVGRRAVCVINVFVRTDRGVGIIISDHVPKILQEGEYFTQLADPTVLDKSLRDIGVVDSTGKEWMLGRKKLKRLKREADALRSSGKAS